MKLIKRNKNDNKVSAISENILMLNLFAYLFANIVLLIKIVILVKLMKEIIALRALSCIKF